MRNILLEPISKVPNSVGINTQIITPLRFILTIDGDHLFSADLIERKPLHTRTALDTKNLVLAVAGAVRRVGRTAADVVVAEKGVQATAVNHHVLAVFDAQSVCVADTSWACGVVIRVGESV
jgi:hypothetical protein